MRTIPINVTKEGCAFTIRTGYERHACLNGMTRGGSGNIPKIIEDMAKKYRIRKLTPTECFALMGVRERERERLTHCGVSESQQYKMAGNSIVVDVLMGIFGQMFNPQPKEDRDQITFPWW